MTKLSDEELITALRERFDANRRAICDLNELTAQLESTNRRLQDSEDLRGHFLSNMRNEINNPLAAIMGFAGQLVRGGCSAEQVFSNGRLIYDEAFELHFQLENVFAAAALEAASETPNPETVDVTELVAEVIGELEHRRQVKRVMINHELAPQFPFVADRRFLKLMLRNLVANAIEFSASGETIAIRVTADDRELTVTVRDNGPGIDPAEQELVFDRFRQLDSGSCKRHRGLGLGLSVCRALAEICGGEIGVDSAPGKGSCFFLTLPRLTGDDGTSPADGQLLFCDTEEKF